MAKPIATSCILSKESLHLISFFRWFKEHLSYQGIILVSPVLLVDFHCIYHTKWLSLLRLRTNVHEKVLDIQDTFAENDCPHKVEFNSTRIAVQVHRSGHESTGSNLSENSSILTSNNIAISVVIVVSLNCYFHSFHGHYILMYSLMTLNCLFWPHLRFSRIVKHKNYPNCCVTSSPQRLVFPTCGTSWVNMQLSRMIMMILYCTYQWCWTIIFQVFKSTKS
jgi:hypothetical protein